MKQNPKARKLFGVFCWLGVAISGFLTGYMLHLAKNYPEIESFTRNTRIAGVLLMVWLAAAVYFTVRAWMDKKGGK
ncbi:MAG: hypothetical protein IJU66_09070 [Oscillospiraceae bacterium]|nr:hypothetical protein [Oscillospiraceae bacterium]